MLAPVPRLVRAPAVVREAARAKAARAKAAAVLVALARRPETVAAARRKRVRGAAVRPLLARTWP